MLRPRGFSAQSGAEKIGLSVVVRFDQGKGGDVVR